MQTPRTYTCALCGETFQTLRTDEEARAEAEALFRATEEDVMEVVCDPCFQLMDSIMPIRKWVEENRR